MIDVSERRGRMVKFKHVRTLKNQCYHRIHTCEAFQVRNSLSIVNGNLQHDAACVVDLESVGIGEDGTMGNESMLFLSFEGKR